MSPLPTPTPSPRAVPAAPSSPASAPSVSRRSLVLVLFSVIACGLLVAAASVVPLLGSPIAGGNGPGKPGDLDGMKSEPAAYALEATSDLADLATLPALPDGLGSLGGVDGAAGEALQQELESAIAALEAAIAQASATMPAVPAGYVPGMEVPVDLPSAQAYPLPSIPTPDLGVGSVLVQAASVTDSPVGTGAGSPLGDALSQLEGLESQLDGLLSDTPLGGLGDLPVEGLPVEGLPLPGQQGPAQVDDADDAVQPDEAGAVAASSHARSALQLTNASFSSAAAELQALLTLYSELAERVEDALAQVEEVHGDAKVGVQEALEQRLAAIEQEVAKLEAQAAGVVDLHGKAVTDARGAAEGAVAKAAAAQSALVAKAGENAVRDLHAQAQAIEAEAEERKAAIDALVNEATVQLGSTAEGAQALQAVQAAAGAATMKLDRDAKAQVAALEAKAEEVQALVGRSQSDLQATATEAATELDAIVEEAVAGDAELLAYLTAQAQAYGSLMEAREAKLAVEAVERLQALADDSSQDIVEEALAGTRAAKASIDRAGDLADEVQQTLDEQVGKDLDYVAKVGEDYGRVPTEERKARAEHWTGVATGLTGALDDALGRGRAVEVLAAQALAAARQAEAEVAALA